MYDSTKFSFNIVSPVYSFNASLVSVAFKLIGYILVAAIASFVGKKFFDSLSSKTANYNFSAGLVDFIGGAAGIILMPILALILLLTIIGIPVSLIILVIYIAMLYVAPVITAALIGDKIFKKQSNRLIKITLGLIIIELCELIPVVGGIIKTLTVFYGFGLMVKVWFSKN